jgi:hypothetical protein
MIFDLAGDFDLLALEGLRRELTLLELRTRRRKITAVNDAREGPKLMNSIAARRFCRRERTRRGCVPGRRERPELSTRALPHFRLRRGVPVGAAAAGRFDPPAASALRAPALVIFLTKKPPAKARTIKASVALFDPLCGDHRVQEGRDQTAPNNDAARAAGFQRRSVS